MDFTYTDPTTMSWNTQRRVATAVMKKMAA